MKVPLRAIWQLKQRLVSLSDSWLATYYHTETSEPGQRPSTLCCFVDEALVSTSPLNWMVSKPPEHMQVRLHVQGKNRDVRLYWY